MSLKTNVEIKSYALVKSKIFMGLKSYREHGGKVPHVQCLDNGWRYYRSVVRHE
jgi:hypothetical protein